MSSSGGGCSNKGPLLLLVAEMVLLLICVRRGLECQAVAESISGRLEMAGRTSVNDDQQQQQQQQQLQPLLGRTLIQGLQEVVTHSRHFDLGQLKLMGAPLRNYLRTCGPCDRISLVEIVTSLLHKTRRCRDQQSHVVQAVVADMLPLMKEKFVQIEYVDFFAELLLALLDDGHNDFQGLATYLWLDEKVSASFSAKLLGSLLEKPSFLADLSMRMDNYQSIIIQTWFRFVSSFN